MSADKNDIRLLGRLLDIRFQESGVIPANRIVAARVAFAKSRESAFICIPFLF
jgi:hypothetical protein